MMHTILHGGCLLQGVNVFCCDGVWLEQCKSTQDHYHEECGIIKFNLHLEAVINESQLLEWAIVRCIKNGQCTNVV